MAVLQLYDCDAWFGRRLFVLPGSFSSKQELLERMDRYGIARALTHYSVSRELDPVAGNRMLMEELAGEPRLTPMWTVMPHHTGEFPAPKALLAQMAEQGVRAVTMFPTTAYCYSMAEWNCGELFSALEDARVPLFLSLPQFGMSFEAIHDFCAAHPSLPLVLSELNYRNGRNLYPLLSKFKNLYMTSSGYKAQDGIEDVCRKFGAERILFGSSMPVGSGASAVAMITYASISDEEKALIASGNLERLLGGVRL